MLAYTQAMANQLQPDLAQLQILLHHGDCLKVMPTLAAGSVAMVFADLPYGLLKWHDWDKQIDFRGLWGCWETLLSDTGCVVLTASMRFASLCIASNPSAFKYDLVWQKLRPTNFMQASKRPLNYHEHVLLFSSSVCAYNEQQLDCSYRRYVEPKSRTQQSTYDNPFYKNTMKTMRRSSQGPMHAKTILPVISKTKSEGSIHPTQKPVALLEWLIKTYTNPGDTVLDPVSGSATTAIAALRTGRNAICIEKDRTYFEAGVKRVHDEVLTTGVDAEVIVHD